MSKAVTITNQLEQQPNKYATDTDHQRSLSTYDTQRHQNYGMQRTQIINKIGVHIRHTSLSEKRYATNTDYQE